MDTCPDLEVHLNSSRSGAREACGTAPFFASFSVGPGLVRGTRHRCAVVSCQPAISSVVSLPVAGVEEKKSAKMHAKLLIAVVFAATAVLGQSPSQDLIKRVLPAGPAKWCVNWLACRRFCF